MKCPRHNYSGLIYLFLVAFAACAETNTNDWSHRIISKTRRPLTSFINPHVSPVNVLIIDGKHFIHVRGLKSFYLQVPNTNSIVFVSDETDYSVTYHVYDMNTDEDIAIHSHSSMSLFGTTIGSANPRDTVTVRDDGIILLSNLDKDAKSTLPELANLNCVKQIIYLDLNKKAILADKAFYYDKAGQLIEE